VTRNAAVDGQWHNVTSPLLTAADADETIAAEIAHHRALAKSFEWKVYAHDPLPDLRDRLARRGFTVGPLEAVLVYDLARPPFWADDLDICAVRRVKTLEDVQVYSRVSSEIFGRAFTFEGELADAVRAGSQETRGYIASCGDQPVAIGRLYTHPQSWFGGMYGGGTRAEFRGRGFYRALVAARARDAIAGGTKYLLVDALPTSRPILERLGFQHLTDTWACEWKPT
jgi:ribosomal protein S18 acetylase RimI-like enzyme